MVNSIDSASLLLGDERIPIWLALAIEDMQRKTDVTVDDVTIATPPTREEPGLRSHLRRMIVRFQDQVIMSNLDQNIDVRLLPSVSESTVRQSGAERRGETGVALPERTTERITSTADIVIHHGVGILKGDILREPEWGVLGYHHGDIRQYRGPGYGFWEYMQDVSTSGVTLQVLDERLDSGEVVKIEPVDIADATTLAEVRRRLNAASVPLLSSGIGKLEDPEFSPRTLEESELGEMYYYSDMTLGVKLKYFITELKSRFARLMSRR